MEYVGIGILILTVIGELDQIWAGILFSVKYWVCLDLGSGDWDLLSDRPAGHEALSSQDNPGLPESCRSVTEVK